MKGVQYWLTAHWPPESSERPAGVFIRRHKNKSKDEAKSAALQLQREIRRGDLVFVYETKTHPENRYLKGKGKVIALLGVKQNSEPIEGKGRWIPVKETRWEAEVDCPSEIATHITGLRQLGKAPLNFGYPLKGTNIQKIDNSEAVRLLKYVCDPIEYDRLLQTYFPDEVENEENDRAYQERARLATPEDYQQGPRKAQFVETNRGRRVKTNPGIAKRRFLMSAYKCEINPFHQTFISESTNNNFVEAHHLVPVRPQIQEEFGDTIALDHESNIVSLCPNCHRLLHHAIMAKKIDILRNLLKTREKELNAAGIHLTVDRLISYYTR